MRCSSMRMCTFTTEKKLLYCFQSIDFLLVMFWPDWSFSIHENVPARSAFFYMWIERANLAKMLQEEKFIGCVASEPFVSVVKVHGLNFM